MGRWSSEPSTRPDRHEAPGVCGDPGTAALVETPRGRGRGGAGAVDRHRAEEIEHRSLDAIAEPAQCADRCPADGDRGILEGREQGADLAKVTE